MQGMGTRMGSWALLLHTTAAQPFGWLMTASTLQNKSFTGAWAALSLDVSKSRAQAGKGRGYACINVCPCRAMLALAMFLPFP